MISCSACFTARNLRKRAKIQQGLMKIKTLGILFGPIIAYKTWNLDEVGGPI